jgi:glycosyltransferase involved in cell wall biosynthesis
MAMISVCMATYNGERFIEGQLASILCQLGERDELIISDDSSTDSTVALAAHFQDPRIQLLEGNIFHSPVYNIESAINKSQGEVIVLSDQDDVWLDNKLSAVRKWFSNMGAGIHLLVLDGEIIDEDGRILHDSLFETLGVRRGVVRNLYRNTYMGCCMAFSRELLDIALPFPRKIPMHDSWLGILGELYGTVGFMPEKTMQYRRHGLNASLGKFATRQQITWRFFLAYHLIRKVLSRRPDRLNRSPRSIPSSQSRAR